jgi:hypothetical protein
MQRSPDQASDREGSIILRSRYLSPKKTAGGPPCDQEGQERPRDSTGQGAQRDQHAFEYMHGAESASHGVQKDQNATKPSGSGNRGADADQGKLR